MATKASKRKDTPEGAPAVEPFFDLASFTQRDTFQVKLIVPGGDQPIPTKDGSQAWVEVYGYTTTQYEDFVRKIQRERAEMVRKGEIDEDDEVDKFEVRARVVSELAVGWHISFAGEYLPFNSENRKKIFFDRSRRFIVDQVYEALHTQGNFIDASANS